MNTRTSAVGDGSLSLAKHEASGVGVREGLDLLRVAWIRKLVLWWGFPYVFQAAMLVVFVGLATFGWRASPPMGVPAKLFAKSNLVTLLIWGLWWPAMVWVAVLLGRAWCMICPLELVGNTGERAGRWINLPQRHLPRWLAGGWLIVILYGTIQLLVSGVALHRSPHLTSAFLWALLALAFVTGLFLRHRAFCRGFCPVGLLLGTYGRGGMLAVRAGGPEKCDACEERHCLRSCNRLKLDARSCPSLLNPPRLRGNRDCLTCGQCIKACQPNNMQLLLRLPFSRHDARESTPGLPTTLFVMLASGFVLGELCTEWPEAQKWFVAAPEWIARRLAAERATGWLEGAWALFVVPAILWTVAACVARAAGARGSILGTWQRLALPMAVIVAAGHMSKGLAKFSTWVSFLPLSVYSPDGAGMSTAIATRSLAAPLPLLPMWIVSWGGCGIVALALAFGVREARLANTDRYGALLGPLVMGAILFGFLIWGWA